MAERVGLPFPGPCSHTFTFYFSLEPGVSWIPGWAVPRGAPQNIRLSNCWHPREEISCTPLGCNLSLPRGVESTGNYFEGDLGRHNIAVKEVFALLKALQTFSSHLVNSRVDVMVDNKVLYYAWLRGGCRNQGINHALKQIFQTVLPLNAALHLEWVPSAANPADQPPREWSDSDVKLAPKFWELVESLTAGHSL